MQEEINSQRSETRGQTNMIDLRKQAGRNNTNRAKKVLMQEERQPYQNQEKPRQQRERGMAGKLRKKNERLRGRNPGKSKKAALNSVRIIAWTLGSPLWKEKRTRKTATQVNRRSK